MLNGQKIFGKFNGLKMKINFIGMQSKLISNISFAIFYFQMSTINQNISRIVYFDLHQSMVQGFLLNHDDDQIKLIEIIIIGNLFIFSRKCKQKYSKKDIDYFSLKFNSYRTFPFGNECYCISTPLALHRFS